MMTHMCCLSTDKYGTGIFFCLVLIQVETRTIYSRFSRFAPEVNVLQLPSTISLHLVIAIEHRDTVEYQSRIFSYVSIALPRGVTLVVRYRHLNLLPQHMALNLETHAKLGGVVYTIARSVPVRRVYPKSLRPGRLPPHPQRFFSSSSYPTNEAVMNVMPVRRSTTRRASVVEMSEMRDEM
ncbi:hypothetical protein MARPO_0101s0056 [Marchantia polymorpha]|nr:hypothetical protein MARPO_0101s0056 [Marchantia polymorpha]|eukprot:PTQ32267.1 hypothetical protein MARPO_0101s0056 [Marchantia polymorpha]